MSWVATAVTVGSVAYGAYEGSQGPSNPTAVFGKKPAVAPFVPTNLQDATSTAVGGDLANFDQVTKYLDSIAPGFSQILAQGLGNAGQEVAGEIPADVQAQVLRDTAEFATNQGGYGGTPMAGAADARNLGLTSLNLTQLGQNSAQQWASAAEGAYSPFTVSTPFQAATTSANNAGQQATAQFANNVAAAPNPAALGQFNYQTAQQQQQNALLLASLGRGGGWGYNPSTGGYGPGASSPIYTGTPVYNFDPSISSASIGGA